ncbi:MAG TPA: hypothetical protein VMR21_06105 [Vicinamibacteria bacterium]|nr:hypothetical protein [Vicinamibacteria bacterium]
MAATERERKRNPHRCDCGAAFDVCYFDDRHDPARDGDPVTVEVGCPTCGLHKTVCVPDGSERTVVVETSTLAEDDVDEGVAG